MFDTNVWLAIDGGIIDERMAPYSDFYSQARKTDNKVIVNDVILGEFFNRACRMQYELCYPEDLSRRNFKIVRSKPEFAEFMDSVRDTCLNMLEDCVYEPAFIQQSDLASLLKEAGTGTIDFSDIAVREHCRRNNYAIVSHDADFANCGLDLITANPRVLRR